MLNIISVLIILVISSLHELVKKFLLYNATLSSSALVEHFFYYSQNRLANQTFYK